MKSSVLFLPLLFLFPCSCYGDIPTEALEALGRHNKKNRGITRRRNNRTKNKQQHPDPVVVEHPRYFDTETNVELNPDYIDSSKSTTRRRRRNKSNKPLLSSQNEHDQWILLQQELQQNQQSKHHQQGIDLHDQFAQIYDVDSGTDTTMRRQRTLAEQTKGILPYIRQKANLLRQVSPTSYWTAVSCIGVFLLWHLLPSSTSPILYDIFSCSRLSIRHSRGLSLILSSISHQSLRHLIVNLWSLSYLVPRYRLLMTTKTATSKSSTTTDLWHFFIGSSIFSNAMFVLFRKQGVCLGLSGVTMALLAACTNASPRDHIRIIVAGIVPISMSTLTLMEILFLISFLGSFSTRSTIAHLVHLGGLIFGTLYYQFIILDPRRFVKGGQNIFEWIKTNTRNNKGGTTQLQQPQQYETQQGKRRKFFPFFQRQQYYQEVKF